MQMEVPGVSFPMGTPPMKPDKFSPDQNSLKPPRQEVVSLGAAAFINGSDFPDRAGDRNKGRHMNHINGQDIVPTSFDIGNKIEIGFSHLVAFQSYMPPAAVFVGHLPNCNMIIVFRSERLHSGAHFRFHAAQSAAGYIFIT